MEPKSPVKRAAQRMQKRLNTQYAELEKLELELDKAMTFAPNDSITRHEIKGTIQRFDGLTRKLSGMRDRVGRQADKHRLKSV
jgi:hypothetical protein